MKILNSIKTTKLNFGRMLLSGRFMSQVCIQTKKVQTKRSAVEENKMNCMAIVSLQFLLMYHWQTTFTYPKTKYSQIFMATTYMVT